MDSVKMGKKAIGHLITWGALFGLALGMFSGATYASANKADKPDSSSDVPVRMVVTAKARHGAQVPAVAEGDVQVYQRNQQNTVTKWIPLQGDRAGLQLFILIDDNARDSLSLQFSSIANFIDEQPASTAIGVGYMRNGTVFVAQDLTNDHGLAKKSLRLPIGAAAGYASPYLALSDLMKRWPDTPDRREVLMITNGIDPLGGGFSNDPFNNPYLDEASNRAQRGGFIVYSIYTPGAGRAGRGFFRTDLAQTGLDVLSQKTGGETYYIGIGTPVDITPYLRDVSNSLKNQYELTFLAQGAKKPALEPVKVKTEMPNMGLKTAESGFVKPGM